MAALALGLLLTTGCGSDPSSRERAGEPRDRPRTSDAVTPTVPAPSARPDESSEAARPQLKERRSVAPRNRPQRPAGNALTIRTTADAHLIGAGAWGADWSIARTVDEAGRMASRCQRATLYDIGATETRLRDFTSDGPAAVQAVSRFGDPKSAWRAEQVLVAWREECADQLRRRDAALGMVRHGAWLSLVEVTDSGTPRQTLRTALDAVEATF